MIKKVPKIIQLRELNQLLLIIEHENYTLEFYNSNLDLENEIKA